MVEHGGFGRSCSPCVVMRCDRVQELGANVKVKRLTSFLDESQPEMHVTEELSFGRLRERGSRDELECPADVVEDRGSQQQVGAQTRMQLRGLAAERRNPDRVLEQPAGVTVVPALRGRQRAEQASQVGIGEEPINGHAQAGVRNFAGEELQEAVELVGVATECRGERDGIGVGCRLERSHIDLQAVAKTLDPAEHAHGVALGEARIQQLHVVPDARLYASARVDELEREVRGAASRPEAPLARDRVRPFDDAFLRQLGDRAHAESLGPPTDARFRPMARIRPFEALRYDEAKAGALDRLVAPPYDVISPEERRDYLARSPYNVVHLTLPDDEQRAGRDLQEWRRAGVLARDDEPAFWALSQMYVGPDGVERTRNGYVVSLRIEPYDRRVVLPHERTHTGPKEGRLRLLRATRTQLEPIFLLHDGPRAEIPERAPDLATAGDRLWRADAGPDVADLELLIADGHHRYETALAYHDEDGTEASAWMMVVLVSTREEGLTIFATHRVAQHVNGVRGTPIDEPPDELPGVVLYRSGQYELLEGDGPDVELVDRLVPEGVTYTASRSDAVATVDAGRAEAAFLLRPTRIEDVFEVARRGDVMPQKSTYFFPKLTSGLLLHPL